jgi:hypothetical protein
MSEVSLKLMEDSDDKCCDLSCQTRVIIAAICGGFGVLLSILSIIEFASGEYDIFAVLYSLSIIAALGASFFVVGPQKHIKRLKEEFGHLVALIVVCVCAVLVFVAVFALKNDAGIALGIILIIIQLVALALFYLSMNTLTWLATKALFRKICSCGGGD